MGYISAWQLAISGPPLSLYRFTQWLNETTFEPEDIFKEIKNTLQESEEAYLSGYILFDGGMGWKCYPNFYVIVNAITCSAQDKFDLAVAFTRIGEDDSDVETKETGDFYIPVIRDFAMPEYSYTPSENEIQELEQYLRIEKALNKPEINRWETIGKKI
jgi:hypothetical protein